MWRRVGQFQWSLHGEGSIEFCWALVVEAAAALVVDDVCGVLGLGGGDESQVSAAGEPPADVAVEAAWSWSRCPFCGFKCRRVHDRRVKRVWDQPVSGRETVLLWQRRRWRCDNCAGRHLEDHPEFEGKLTRRLARRLVGDVAVMPISAAAREVLLSKCPFWGV